MGGISQKRVGLRVMMVDTVHFLFGDWVGIGPLFILFPRMFWVLYNRESPVKDCYGVGEGAFCWHVLGRTVLHHLEES